MSILAPSGFKAPTLQASGKQDGGGNGDGGMFFGQQQQEQPTPMFNNYFGHEADTSDIPYAVPTLSAEPSGLQVIRNALALSLYQYVADHPFPTS